MSAGITLIEKREVDQILKRYSLGQIGVEFRIKLLDTDNPYNPVPIDLTNNTELKIIFTRPDGTTFSEDAEVADDNLEDTEIKYVNDSESILDQRGLWSYTASVKYTNNNYIKGIPKQSFWII